MGKELRNEKGMCMKTVFARLVWFAVLALGVWTCAGCGGHERKNKSSDDSSGNSNNAAAPSFNPSGEWSTSMDSTALGTTTFSMDSAGNLSGSLKTDNGESGSLSGVLSGSDAEYTVKFHSRAYLVTLTFNSAHTSASGTMVDADGHSHHLKLSKS